MKRVQGLAPKISAASANSFGISCRPAIRITSTMAVARQSSASTMAKNRATGVSCESHPTGPWMMPRRIERGVQIAGVLQQGEPGKACCEIRDAERNGEHPQDQVAALVELRHHRRHGERQHDLERHDHEGEQERVLDRRARSSGRPPCADSSPATGRRPPRPTARSSAPAARETARQKERPMARSAHRESRMCAQAWKAAPLAME